MHPGPQAVSDKRGELYFSKVSEQKVRKSGSTTDILNSNSCPSLDLSVPREPREARDPPDNWGNSVFTVLDRSVSPVLPPSSGALPRSGRPEGSG